ncbi:MAG: acyl-CoA dehydrogenase family protein [Blastocatellia bacterium]|nr:acyl-CoA dehydrogenase family protein [Blastocatellia bacterium]
MDELLSKENLKYREQTREIAERYVRPVAAELDRIAEYPWSVVRALQEAGLMGVWIPKEYGGHGAGVLNLCIVVEELSKACGGVGVTYAVNALGSFPLILGGTEEQKKKYLPDLASGRKLIAFGLSEKKSGSDAGSLQTRATKSGDDYLINGEKKWNTNGGAADIYSVFTTVNPERGGRGITAFIVEKGMEGFRIGKKEDLMGIRCVPVHELHFENCRVSPDRLLGGKEGHGSARAADLGAKNVSKFAAMAKVFATDTAMAVTTNCVQLFGGYGYCKDYPIEKYMRDAKITQIYEGTNQVQRVVISRALIKEAAGG